MVRASVGEWGKHDRIAVLTALITVVAVSRMQTMEFVGGVLVTLAFISTLAWKILFRDGGTVVIIRWTAACLAVPILIWIGHVLLTPSLDAVITLTSQILIIGIALFFFPRVFSFYSFCVSVSLVSALLIAVGFIPVFGGPSEIGSFAFPLWTSHNDWFPIEHPIRSVLGNPNNIGMLSVIGAVGGIAAFIRTRRWRDALIGIFCIIGVFAAQYRTGILILAAVAVLYLSYMLFGQIGVIATTFAGAGAALIGVSVAMGVVPGPNILTEQTFNNRTILWNGSISAIADAPLAGYGFGGGKTAPGPYLPADLSGYSPHNSFLHIAVEAGVFAGVAYAALFVSLVLDCLRSIDSIDDVGIYTLLTATILIQMTESATIFGTAVESVVMALVIGYAHFWVLDSEAGSRIDA